MIFSQIARRREATMNRILIATDGGQPLRFEALSAVD